jgi:hypothetical protein
MARRDWSKSKHYLDRLLRRNWLRPKPRGPGGVALPEPVEPDPRKPRSGGAEAALEFDD